MFRPHLSYVGAISVNRRTSGYPWRGGPVRSDFQWRLLYPVNLRCLARSGRWRQRSSEWLGMLVIMVWTRCQVFISQVHNSWILNHSNVGSPQGHCRTVGSVKIKQHNTKCNLSALFQCSSSLHHLSLLSLWTSHFTSSLHPLYTFFLKITSLHLSVHLLWNF